jgi:hypothetical protein
MKLRILGIALLVLAGTQMAVAELRNDVPSCRKLLFHEEPVSARNYVIAVDKTTVLDEALTKDTVERAVRSLQAGDRIQLVSFSGLNKQQFIFTHFDARIDKQPSDAELNQKIPAAQVGKTQACFSRQPELVKKKVGDLLTELLTTPLANNQQAKSEIIKAIDSIAKQNLSADIPERQLLLISDMLENSDIDNFYAADWQTRLDKHQQIRILEKEHFLISNLQGARVFVAGASAVSGNAKQKIGLKERQAVKQFWSHYFEISNGELKAWGEPALLSDII